MFNFLKRIFGQEAKYESHPEAVIISCFYNPQKSPYRLKAFNHFYNSIRHLNHIIIECVIGNAKPQLPESKNIKRVYTENLLWHKEALLNKIITEFLPTTSKYVFWVDADIIFANKNWVVEGVEELKSHSIIQPFEFCIHLERNELKPSFNVDKHRAMVYLETYSNRRLWRSFSANFKTASLTERQKNNYNIHGHVGFAWAARREILEQVPLYDRALIGGADHIIAHAAAGQIPHSCITKSFTDNLDEVLQWSKKFYKVVKGNIGYVKGDLYHIWHGDIDRRQYLKRIQDFTAKTKQIIHRDENGLYVTHQGDDEYVKKYFQYREVASENDYYTSVNIDMNETSSQDTVDEAIIADTIIKDSAIDSTEPSDFGAGGSGGGGAGGSWDTGKSDSTYQAVVSDNFS